MPANLSDALKVIRLKPDGSGFTVAAGSTDVNGDVVDTSDCEGVVFITGFGAITAGAVTSCKVQQDTASNMSGAQDLAGTSQAVLDTDDNKIVIQDVFRPVKRYLRSVTKRATQNAVVDFQLAIKYGVKTQPISNDATVSSREVHVSPAEGTA